MNDSVTIIAEAGVNHNGDLNLAKQMVAIAADAGADYIKFQTFQADLLANPSAPKANYQLSNSDAEESQHAMLKRLELSKTDHEVLFKECEARGIKFLSSPFDLPSVDLLVELGVEAIKIPSGEITNLPYLKKVGALGIQLILSSGMSNINEITTAFKILTYSGTAANNITILQCTSQYPAYHENANLSAMQQIKSKVHHLVGFSDHTIGDETAIAAVALGAIIIEKHFTTNKNLPGPDHSFSVDPTELKELVRKIRNVEKALAKEIKSAKAAELEVKTIARKSIHLNEDLPKGTILTEAHLIMQRPGNGISPMDMDAVVGKKTTSNLKRFHQISFSDLA